MRTDPLLPMFRWAFAAPLAAPVFLVLAALAAVYTTAQGLVGVLVVLASCGMATRTGPRAGLVFAAVGGVSFLALRIQQDRTDGVGLVLTVVAVMLWMSVAWTAGKTVQEIRELDASITDHLDEMHTRSLHDPLTGLANRDLLLDRLSHALQRAERRKGHVAVLFLDLDEFKLVNDGFGHAAGDELLVQVGQRLRAQLRGSDTAARLGGDEFVLVCEDLVDLDDSVRIANRIAAALRPPFIIDGREVSMSASIGVAVPPSTTQAPHELLQDADRAMYRAKQNGGGRFDVYNEVLRSRAIHRLDIETELRRAVSGDELRLAYQPIIDLTNHEVSGVEALVRWEHPTRGLLSPAEFLPIAESSSLMVDIGAWVLEEACAQARKWQPIAGRPLTMSINVSLRQIISGSFDADLSSALDHSGVDPSLIRLEITETTLLQATQSMRSQLATISERGISVGLDDFGTGYSSLSLIKAFPVCFLKIDQSFICGLGKQTDNTTITSAVIDLGRHLDLQTIAEGVETSDQLSELRRLGCDYGQGYHLSRPQPANRIDRLLHEPSVWQPAGAGVIG